MKAVAPGQIVARKMVSADVAAVAEIETSSFSAPWSPETFETLLDRPAAELWVLDHRTDGVVGYAVAWCIFDQGELANIAIVDAHRGRGHGRTLLGTILEVARGRGVESLFLEVRVSNTSAITLYESFGFTHVGVRKRYYDKPEEDALVMVKGLRRGD